MQIDLLHNSHSNLPRDTAALRDGAYVDELMLVADGARLSMTPVMAEL